VGLAVLVYVPPTEIASMNTVWWISYLVLWLAVLFLGFLLLGTLRALGLLRWRLEQLELTTPRRVGRDGLKPGTRAPDFTLPGVTGATVALHDFAGRSVVLVFTQAGCKPCRQIVPALNRLQQKGAYQVLAVAHGDPEKVRQWAGEVGACFPVLTQPQWDISRRYQVFATPFAFLIDGHGVIRSKGIVSTERYLRFLLSEARRGARGEPAVAARESVEASKS
jgi:methylamine dehydrogenase accessory protein MauD